MRVGILFRHKPNVNLGSRVVRWRSLTSQPRSVLYIWIHNQSLIHI